MQPSPAALPSTALGSPLCNTLEDLLSTLNRVVTDYIDGQDPSQLTTQQLTAVIEQLSTLRDEAARQPLGLARAEGSGCRRHAQILSQVRGEVVILGEPLERQELVLRVSQGDEPSRERVENLFTNIIDLRDQVVSEQLAP
jgi:hypothetical protein